MELATGTLLHGGTYRILNASEIIPKHKYTYLGQGSFGITYLAEHTSLGRKVAIKEFFMKELNTRGEDGSISGMTDGSLSYNYGQKFKKEAINLSQLEHPNIVRVTDSFEENGTYYYVMDYIEGENLNDYLKHNTVSQQEAVSIITDVAKALQYMHDTKHMLHLDLKPGNIMRRASDGHIFLIDFGLSKHYSSNGQPDTTTSIGLGTLGYAPIEQSNQAKNGEFRPTIDVYALGATLYKLLTRETPPAASDIVSDDELIEDKLRANGITGNIIGVIVNAMLPNVKKRTQTVKAFVDALKSNSTSSNPTSNVTSSKKEEVNTVNEETCIIGQPQSSEEKLASVKTQAFNIDQYKIPVYFSTDPKDTERRAVAGNEEAMFALAIMYLRAESKFQDFDAAYRWLNTCKTNGDGRAAALLNNWEWLKLKYKKNETPFEIGNPKEKGAIDTKLQNDTNGIIYQIGKKLSNCITWIVAIMTIVFCFDLYCKNIGIFNVFPAPDSYVVYSIFHNIGEMLLFLCMGVILKKNQYNLYFPYIVTGNILWITSWILIYFQICVPDSDYDTLVSVQSVTDLGGSILLAIGFLYAFISITHIKSRFLIGCYLIYATLGIFDSFMRFGDISDENQIVDTIKEIVIAVPGILYIFMSSIRSLYQDNLRFDYTKQYKYLYYLYSVILVLILGTTFYWATPSYASKFAEAENMYEGNEGVLMDKERGFKIISKLADKNYGPALYAMCEIGRELDVDSSMVKSYFNQALESLPKEAESGDMYAQRALASLYLGGYNMQDMSKEIISLLEKSVAQGYAKAMRDLAFCYLMGTGVKENPKKAFSLMKQAAGKGNLSAEDNLAFFYQEGIGCDADVSKAFHWYSKASKHGSSLSSIRLGDCYFYGNGTKQDYKKAIALFEKTAEIDNSVLGEVGLRMGYAYSNGCGVKKNAAKSFEWYMKAAEAGNPDAQYSVAFMFHNGDGVAQNEFKAVEWLRKAADLGNTDAMNALADCYEYGIGVKASIKEAKKWRSMANAK